MKNLLILIAVIFAAQSSNAQSGAMKEPVSFKLKNGLTVIVAENTSATNVFSSFSPEANLSAEVKIGAREVLTAMLNNSAAKLANQVSFTEKGGNIKAVGSDFDMALSALSSTVQQPVLSQDVFELCKTELIKSVNAKDRYYSTEMNEEALSALTLNDIRSLHHDLMVPGSTYLTIAGSISVVEAKILAKKAFGSWRGAEAVEISK